jgi:cobalt/nickel transport system permease protein
MWAVSAGTIAYCSKKVHTEMDSSKVPLMGVMGAFIFAAQMINFTIPATGSSGHLGGGVMLAILLGPYAAFLAIASVLIVQALLFADGGILALGCNIFNMGFWPAFVVYPFIYRKIIGINPSQSRITVAVMISAIAGLQLGAFSVVMETLLSGISALPFATFLVLMQPIHLAIGVVEGLATIAVVSFVYKARPEILSSALEARPVGSRPVRNVALIFLLAAGVMGGFVSRFASGNPDGLEWAVSRITGTAQLEASQRGIHGILGSIQDKTALLPDYSFALPAKARKEEPKNLAGTSIAGLVGGTLTLVITVVCGFALKKRTRIV